MQTINPVSETGFPAGNAVFRFSSLVAEPPCLNGVLSRINQKLFKYRLDRTGIYWWTATADDVWLLLGVISLNLLGYSYCVFVWYGEALDLGSEDHFVEFFSIASFSGFQEKNLGLSQASSASALSTEPSCWPWVPVLCAFLLAVILESLLIWIVSVSSNHRACEAVGNSHLNISMVISLEI